MLPTHRRATSPGEMLLEEFLKPLDMSAETAAARMALPIQTLAAIIAEQGDVTPEIADKLATLVGTSADFWLHLQRGWMLTAHLPR